MAKKGVDSEKGEDRSGSNDCNTTASPAKQDNTIKPHPFNYIYSSPSNCFYNGPGKIHEAILNVAKDVGAITKNQTNAFHNYKYRGIDDVYNIFHNPLIKHGITVNTKVLNYEHGPNYDKNELVKGNISFMHLQVRFTAEDGSYIESEAIGESADTSDKSAMQAGSQAYKEIFFKTFLPPVDEGVVFDADSVSPEVRGSVNGSNKKNGVNSSRGKVVGGSSSPSFVVPDNAELEKMGVSDLRRLYSEADKAGAPAADLARIRAIGKNKKE